MLVLPGRGSHPPGQSPGVLLDIGCRPAPADACTTLGRTPHAQDRQPADNTSSPSLFGCDTHSISLVPLLYPERSLWHLLADALVAALPSALHGSVAHSSHDSITEGGFADTKESQPHGIVK